MNLLHWWLNLSSTVLTFCMFAGTTANASGIMFFKERIDAIIRAQDTMEIRGVYWFINEDKSALSISIYYPFPVDSFSAYPHMIELERLPTNQPIPFDTLREGIRWRMKIESQAVDSVRVIYRQRVNHLRGKYIVTTAKHWGRPLQSADFSVSIPPQLSLDYWSFQYDSLSQKGDTIIYHRHSAPFSPDADMLMRWQLQR